MLFSLAVFRYLWCKNSVHFVEDNQTFLESFEMLLVKGNRRVTSKCISEGAEELVEEYVQLRTFHADHP